MLELAKILKAIDNLGRERAESLSGVPDQLSTAAQVISNIDAGLADAQKRIADARTSWLVANFDQPPGNTFDLPEVPAKHAVVAVDGSQIMPDKHEVTLCYLLNASGIILYYGTGEHPFSETVPKLCYQEEDLFEGPYGKRRVPVNDKILGMKRTLAESAEMERMIQAASASGVPVVALWDGSLIRWVLENEPQDYKERVLKQYLHTFEMAKELHIPIAGYISDPGSKDFVNSLKIMLCDQPRVDCDFCAYKDGTETPPCDAVGRLKDTTLYRERLSAGKRTVLFTSSSSILEKYGEHKVYAFYMDVGREVVRIEIPKWVAEDQELLNLTHAVCFDQAIKGRGYPIALAEAHEHAVVTGPDRRAFYEMLERSFIKHGARIPRSTKRISKGY